MAFRVLRLVGITNSLKNHCCVGKGATVYSLARKHDFLKAQTPSVGNVRNTSFFNKLPADKLWSSVTSVSNAGRRRGRAKGRSVKKDLNKGQSIGEGKIRIQFPGLNIPVIRGKEIMVQKKLSDASDRDEKLIQLRSTMVVRKRRKHTPLERGWSSHGRAGMKIGPPNNKDPDAFKGFQSWVLKDKISSYMTGNIGRVNYFSMLVITGNGNGLAGLATTRMKEAVNALTVAKRRAGQRLLYFNRYNDHTVLHDFYVQCGRTKIFVQKKEEGYGIVAHRVIKCCCEAIGIKDLHAKVEGAMNYHNIAKGFLEGLQRQKTFQQMADEKQLHLVEFREENDNFPVVVASPARVRTEEEIEPSEVLDFDHYLMDGNVVLRKKKNPPFYTRLDSWVGRCRKMERLRNKSDVRIRLLSEYGVVRSFLADKYPEAREKLWSKKRVQEEAEAKAN